MQRSRSTVAENTPSLPNHTIVGYSPPGAETAGVTIGASGGVAVIITNDFTGVDLQKGSVQLTKTVVKPQGATLPASFTAHVVCNDGTDTTVTMPAAGGAGTPVLTPNVGSICGVEETPVPAGWTVTYSVNGGSVTTTVPVFTVTSSTTTISRSAANATSF